MTGVCIHWVSEVECYVNLIFKLDKGGIIENLFPRLDTHNLDELWASLFKSYYKNSLMGCALEGEMFEGLRDDGLHALHAYIVTKMAVAMCKDGEKRLVRIKNPHGKNSM